MNSEPITQRIWQHSKMTGVNKLILLALAQHADSDGFCWPGYEALGKMTGVDKRNAMRNLDPAIKSGEVMVYPQQGQLGGRGYTNIYLIIVGLSPEQIQEIIDRRIGDKKVSKETLLETRSIKKDDNFITYIERKSDKVDTLSTDMSDKIDTPNDQKGDESDTRIKEESFEKEEKEKDIKFSKICRLHEQEIGLLSPMIRDDLLDMSNTYPLEWITEAFKRAVRLNKRSTGYILGILKNWQAIGGPQNDKPEGERRSLGKGYTQEKEQSPTGFSPSPELPPAQEVTPEQSLWARVIKSKSSQIPPWLQNDIKPGQRHNGTLDLLVSTDDAKTWVDKRLLDKIILPAVRYEDSTINRVDVIVQTVV